MAGGQFKTPQPGILTRAKEKRMKRDSGRESSGSMQSYEVRQGEGGKDERGRSVGQVGAHMG